MKTKVINQGYIYGEQYREQEADMATFEWNGIVIHVKRCLTMTKMLEFVATVTEMCFDDDGEYMPEILDYAINSNIVSMYTDLDMPNDLEEQYSIVACTTLPSLITEYIDMSQFNEMVRAIERKLKYLSESNSAKMRSDVERLFDMFGQLQEKVSQAMQTLVSSDISKISSAIEDGKFSPESLIKAYSEMIRSEELTADGNQS